MVDTLHIAEIPYDTGEVQFRYSRRRSKDGSSWIRHGLFQSFAKDGTLLSEGEYVDGKEQGQWRDYHPNGRLAGEGTYIEGIEADDWRFWDSDGNPEEPTRT